MAIEAIKLENALKLAFPDAVVLVKDLAGDQEHYSLEITSEKFKNKTKIEQHKMVYQALQEFDIHALQIKTNYPSNI